MARHQEENNQPVLLQFHTHGLQLPPTEDAGPAFTPDGALAKRRAKVKTGCFTCKTRKVKCDETRPGCLRCTKFGVSCDGYPAPSARSIRGASIQPQAKRSLLPLVARPTHSLQPKPMFADEQEGQCFRIYCEVFAAEVKGPIQTSLWDYLIPQVAEAEPFIRHAVIALGAMKRISLASDIDKDDFDTGHCVDYPYALKQFDKALRGMRKTISDGKQDIQKALIACILVFCFQTISNKPNSAVVNAESGLMLLHHWMRNSLPDPATNEQSEQHIEEDLMVALATLDLQTLFFRDTRTRQVHEFVVDSTNIQIAKMPAEFDTLKSAYSFWMVIMRRNFHFLRIALEEGRCSELCSPRMSGDGPWEDSVNCFPGGNIFSTPAEPPFELYAEGMSYCAEVDQWTLACAELFEHLLWAGTEDEKTLVNILQMHALVSLVLLKSAFFAATSEFDQFLPEFQRILSLAEQAIPGLTALTGGKPVYHYDLGVIVGISLAGCKSQDYALRTRAIEMLRRVPMQDGFWETGSAEQFLEWGRELDEEGRDEYGFVPEHERWFVNSAFVNLDKKKAILGATQRSLNGLVFREKEISWSE